MAVDLVEALKLTAVVERIRSPAETEVVINGSSNILTILAEELRTCGVSRSGILGHSM